MAQPKAYKVRFIEPGIISYEDKNAGTVLVSREALDRMASSFKGCPVIFVPEFHNGADKTNSFNLDDPNAPLPAGVVAENPVWGEDGWMWVNLLVWGEDAIEALDKGHNVSCSYITDEEGSGGVWHELSYDAEVINGHYMHMAIVPRPRYEGSRVFANSKGGPEMGFKIFQKKNAATPEKGEMPPAAPAQEPEKEPAAMDPAKANALENDDSTEVDVNGVRVPLHELISDYVEKHGEGEPAGEDIDPSTPVSLPDGTQVTIGDLIASYSGGGGEDPMEPAENAAPEGSRSEPDEDNKVKANSAPVKRKVNKALQNAASGGGVFAADTPMTKQERAAEGRRRYGLGKNDKGGEA